VWRTWSVAHRVLLRMNTLLLEKTPAHQALKPALTPWYEVKTTQADGSTLHFGEMVRTQTVTHNAGRCWDGYEPTPGKEAYSNDSCRKKGSGKKKKKKKKKKEAMTKTTENASVVPGKGGIHLRGSDADKDGKTGEGKKKIKDFSDRNGNGTPDAFERSSSSEYDSEYESTSEDEKSQGNGMAKKRANASAIEDEDGGACVSPKALAKKARAIADAVKATLSNSDGRVHVA